MADRLECAVMTYAWGSRETIAGLQGRPFPTPTPEAELWMGAHPTAPAQLMRNGVRTGLDQLVAHDPPHELGVATYERFGARLPFLLKVLAAAEPLSLQAHPDAMQARAGFAREEQAGVPIDSPVRLYQDDQHKPELIVAVTPFHALCGFRRLEDTKRLLDALSLPELAAIRVALDGDPPGVALARAFDRALTEPREHQARIVRAVGTACLAHQGAFREECEWVSRLAQVYPEDPAVVAALLLNLVRLSPGEGLFLRAGSLHAYLGGTGIEIMASSNNVLRAGLTRKHVDVEELRRTLSFDDRPVTPLVPERIDEVEQVWRTPADEFCLSQVSVRHLTHRIVTGPEVVLCYEGAVTIVQGDEVTPLPRGAAAFVRGSSRTYALSGEGTLFRAAVPESVSSHAASSTSA